MTLSKYDKSQAGHEEVGLKGNNELPVYSIGELNAALKSVVEEKFSYVRVRGEISGFKRAASGHLYMTLKDVDSNIDAVCWRGTADKIIINPEDGLEVIVTGRVTTYPSRSKYQLTIENLEIAGVGALLKMIEERRRLLESEGLFEETSKKLLPYLPEVIGVITSPTGSVFQDIMHRLNDRFPRRVFIWPVLVQGEKAAEQIVAAIKGFNTCEVGGQVPRPDLLIVARGGGSLEDLMVFNEESLVRAVAASKIPLISAVGHETDTTLIDYAADKRAPTPTAAAELAVPVRNELLVQLSDDEARLFGSIRRHLGGVNERLMGLARGLPEPRRLIESAMQRTDDWSERLHPAMNRVVFDYRTKVHESALHLVKPNDYMNRKRSDLGGILKRGETLRLSAIRTLFRENSDIEETAKRLGRSWQVYYEIMCQRLYNLENLLESYSYKGVLERGFAVVRESNGSLVTGAEMLSKGESISLSFKEDGYAEAMISFVEVTSAKSLQPNKVLKKKLVKEKNKSKDDIQGSLL